MSGRAISLQAVKNDAPVWLLYLASSAWAISPVLGAPAQRVIGWVGDNVQYLYMLGWVAKALRIGANPFIDPHLNYPSTLQLASTDAPFLGFFIFAPLTWLTNEVFTYNLLLFLSFFLSGLFTYLWIKRVTSSRFAGFVAGLIFLLAPYRFAHSVGHINLVSTQFFPLFFWALDAALQSDRPAWRRLALLSLTTFLVGAMSMYYLVICLLCGCIYAISSHPNIRFLFSQGWKFFLSVLTGAVISALPYIFVWLNDGFQPTDLEMARNGSAGLFNFIIPAYHHPLWGKLVLSLNPVINWVEFTLYVGLVALVLVLQAIVWRGSPYRLQMKVWLVTLFFAFVMALGTDLHLFEGRALMPEHPIWLPAFYLSHIPLVGIMRIWSRFGILVSFFVALLAGLGAARLEQRFASGSNPIVRFLWQPLLIGLIVLDFLPGGIYSVDIKPRSIDQWLAAQPGDFSFGYIPNVHANQVLAMYASLDNEKRMADFPERTSLTALRNFGLRYIIIQSSVYDGQKSPSIQTIEAALAAIPRLQKVAVVDEYLIYEFIR
jgi:hypothetical protein